MSSDASTDGSAATPYLDALLALRDTRRPARFMVPGHKGGRGASPRLRDAFGGAAGADAVLGLDIPLHVRGIDVGSVDDAEPSAVPPLDQARALAARAWGASSTHFVVGGASQANHIICLALAILAQGRKPRVAVQRNVHQSTIYGLILANAETVWLEPEVDRCFGVQHGVSPAELARVLEDNADQPLDAVMLVSPTYFGAVSRIEELKKEINAARPAGDLLLVVDEAWGSHFAFGTRFPTTAMKLGADIVVSSTHKTLGSLTQSAMLHIGSGPTGRSRAWLENAIKKARNLVKTTSPNALLMASLDAARAYAEGDGGRLLDRAAEQADRVRAAALSGAFPGIRVLDDSIVEQNKSVKAFDPLRVTFEVLELGRRTGDAVQRALWRPGEGGVEIEMCTADLVVLLYGIGDADGGSTDQVIEALGRLPPAEPSADRGPDLSMRSVEKVPRRHQDDEKTEPPPTLRDGYLGDITTRRLEESAESFCAEIVAPYPPGIAVIMPGELLTDEIVQHLLRIRDHVEFSDCADPTLKTIEVLVGGGTLERRKAPPPVVERPPPG